MASVKIQPIVPSMKWVQEGGQLTTPAYDIMQNIFLRIGGSLSNLDATSLLGSTWNVPGTLGFTTPNTAKITNLTVTKGMANDGGGIKHKRVPFTVPASSTSYISATWATPFLDDNYTATYSVQYTVGASAFTSIDALDYTKVMIRIDNPAAYSISGFIHIIAIHN